MPPFIRKRRPWDWLLANELGHLPVPVRQRLQEKVNQKIEQNPRRKLTLMVSAVFLAGSCLFCCGFPADFFEVNFALGPSPPPLTFFDHVATYPFRWLSTGIIGLIFLVGVPYLFVIERRRYRSYLRDLMLAEGLKPRYCFDCGYYVEGFNGDECPNCSAALMVAK